MSDATLLSETDASGRSSWRERLGWGAVVGLGLLIYELTARPSFGIAVACLKFGWTDFDTAVWLLWRDPFSGRGRTCFWFVLAFGLWKVTVAAFIITGSLLALVTILGRNGPDELFHLGLTAAVGITLLGIVPMVGVSCARHYGVRVWIDGSITQSRRRNAWPPEASQFNSVPGLLFPAMLVPILASAVLGFRLGGPVIVPVAMFITGVFIWGQFGNVTARTPEECWSPSPSVATGGEHDS